MFDSRKQFLEGDRIFGSIVREPIEVATMSGILRIALPLFLPLEVGHPQSSVFLSGVGESGEPKLRDIMVRSRFAVGSWAVGWQRVPELLALVDKRAEEILLDAREAARSQRLRFSAVSLQR